MRATRSWAYALLTIATLGGAGPAAADISGPDDSIAQAYGPLQPATDYFGALRTSDDIDYASFVVAHAGESLHFDVENTVGRCLSPYQNGCPMYATLIDGAAQQVGDEGSGAGTGPVDAGATDVIDWTFDRAGTYYVVFDSDGDLPTYRVHYTVAPDAPLGAGPAAGGGSAGGAPTTPATTPGTTPGTTRVGASPTAAGAAASDLRVRSPQHGPSVTARVSIGRPLRSLRATLAPAGGGPTLGTIRLIHPGIGTRTLRVTLDHDGARRLARRKHLRLRFRLVATPDVGPAVTLVRRVTLVSPRR